MEQSILRLLLRGWIRGRLLDLGAGTGRLTPLLSEHGSIVSVDIEPELLRNPQRGPRGRKELGYALAEATRLPFRNATFDAVVLIRVLHRLPDAERALREIRRVTRVGGSLFLSYFPTPSLKTLEYDLGRKFRGERSVGSATRLWGRDARAICGPGFGYVASRGATASLLEKTGFRAVREFGCGFEELPLADRLPVSLYTQLGRALWRAPLFPTYIGRCQAV